MSEPKKKKKRFKGKSTTGKVREPIKIVKAKKVKQPQSLGELLDKRKPRKIREVVIWGKRKRKQPPARPMFEG